MPKAKAAKATKARVFHPGATAAVEITPHNGTNFGLKELYGIIGCQLIQVINLNDDEIMIMDEEGKLSGQPVNLLATAHADHVISPNDCIVGIAVICPSSMLQ